MQVLVLNASLKHGNELSNTEEVTNMVLEEMRKYGRVDAEAVRLADKRIPVGLGFRESDDDEWPEIADRLRQADIVIFATPIWWGQRSSLIQRVIERMDAFDEEAHSGRADLLNKVAGVVITGSEDGAQAVLAGIMEVLTFMNFTLPPQCCTYWVGEVGLDPKTDRERRLKNKAVGDMAATTGRNLMYYGKLLKDHPLVVEHPMAMAPSRPSPMP
jgi:multimeric flavodoxin WrbA